MVAMEEEEEEEEEGLIGATSDWRWWERALGASAERGGHHVRATTFHSSLSDFIEYSLTRAQGFTSDFLLIRDDVLPQGLIELVDEQVGRESSVLPIDHTFLILEGSTILPCESLD